MIPAAPAVGPPDLRRPAEVLARLELAVTHRLDGILHGDHQGLLAGHGSEPGDSRAYLAGDDVRRMDWNLTARTTVPHVRDAIADRELEVWAVVDRSASLDFGTAGCTKRDLALGAVASVGFLAARGGNRVGAVLVDPGRTTRVPARSGRTALMALLHTLSRPTGPEGAGPCDLAGALETSARVSRRRGMVVVVSDLLAPPGWERPLRALARRHQVLVVEVIDPRELELPSVGHLTVVDPETGARREVATASAGLRRRYAEAAAAQRAAHASTIRACRASHLVLRTDRDWLGDVVRFVVAGRRLRAGRPVVGP